MEEAMVKGSRIANIINNNLDELGNGLFKFGVRFIVAILILVIGFKCIKYIVKIIKRIFERSNMDPSLQGFLISASKIGLKVMVVFWAITSLGVAASSIVAIIGSAGLALGLSLQGSLSNIAGGVLLLFMKPFQIGDYIMAAGQEGSVVLIGIMYTKLRTKDNRIILIPNSKLSSDTIVNVSYEDKRQEDITVGIEYSENIKKVRCVLQSVIDAESVILKDEETEIFVNAMEDSYIEMRIRFWVPSDQYWPCRWRTLENIKEAFDQNGINIPFNQLDVNIIQK